MAREQIGLFGGTFDPPHLGHLILASEAHSQLGLDRLLWILTPDPPHKQDQVINWSGKPIKGARVEIRIAVPNKNVTLVSGGKVQSKKEGKSLLVTFDLDVADALVLR